MELCSAKQGLQSLFLCLLLCASVWAQTTSTGILGTVTHTNGALVPATKVIALNVKTGTRCKDVTSSSGDFTFPPLDVGEQNCTVR